MIAASAGADVFEDFIFEIDVRFRLCIEFDSIIMLIDIGRNFGLLESGFIHLLAPTAPLGVYIHYKFPGFGLVLGLGFFPAKPVDLGISGQPAPGGNE